MLDAGYYVLSELYQAVGGLNSYLHLQPDHMTTHDDVCQDMTTPKTTWHTRAWLPQGFSHAVEVDTLGARPQ